METIKMGVGTLIQKADDKKKCLICGNKFEIINIELQNYIDGNIVWKKEDIAYCRNCNKYFFRSDYDTFVYKHPGYFDFKLVQHVKKRIEEKNKKESTTVHSSELKEEKKELHFNQREIEKKDIYEDNKENNKQQINKVEEEYKLKEEKNLSSADFFVRSNTNSCSKKNHNIIDFLAEVDVICSNGNVIKKAFPASYCEDCKLYFMYDKEYKRLRKIGVPLCSIYEYSKYIKAKNIGRIELKPESLLHSFGYNVGATERLTAKQRQKILSFVINNGIMSKHEIINLLSYFVDFRKNDIRQSIAIAKWKMDIDYIQNTNIETNKKVEINSIRVVNIIKDRNNHLLDLKR